MRKSLDDGPLTDAELRQFVSNVRHMREQAPDYWGHAAVERAERIVAEIVGLRAERDEWRRRAEAHGCNVDEGDADCG